MIRRLAPFFLLLFAGAVIGYGLAQFGSKTPRENAAGIDNGGERKILYWWDPMVPGYRSDKPGKSPMGMDLVPFYEGEKSNASGASSVRIDPSVENNIGVRTAPVEVGSLRRPIQTVGRIVYDAEKVANVNLRTSGWIERLAVRAAGEPVEKGALLFEVYSPDLVNAQAEFIQTLRGGNPVHISAGKDRLRALFISEDQIKELEQTRRVQQYVKFYAPIGGVVTALNVADGQFFNPDTEIMTLADLSTVWLMSDVFESDADQLRLGAVVSAQSKFEAGVKRSGAVDYIYPDLSPVTRTVPVRTIFDNVDGKLKPGMYMTVEIEGPERPATAIIPRPALIRTGRQERVILALGEGRFQPAAVTSGIEADGKVEILSGLSPDDIVVVSGQFLLDSESSLAGASLRMQPADNAGGVEPIDHSGHESKRDDPPPSNAPTINRRNDKRRESNHADHPTATSSAASLIRATGVIRSIDASEQTITVEHDSIPEIDWPGMTMEFSVDHGVDLSSIKTGERISFAMSLIKDRGYIVQSVEKLR